MTVQQENQAIAKMTARCAQYMSAVKLYVSAIKQPTIAQESPLQSYHYSAVKLFSKYSNQCDHAVETDRRTLWHHRAVKIIRQIIADIIGIADILTQSYRYMAHHYSLAIRQAFWKLPDVTHFRVLSTIDIMNIMLSTGLCSVHACGVPNEL